jgi:hypothetical protein
MVDSELDYTRGTKLRCTKDSQFSSRLRCLRTHLSLVAHHKFSWLRHSKIRCVEVSVVLKIFMHSIPHFQISRFFVLKADKLVRGLTYQVKCKSKRPSKVLKLYKILRMVLQITIACSLAIRVTNRLLCNNRIRPTIATSRWTTSKCEQQPF